MKSISDLIKFLPLPYEMLGLQDNQYEKFSSLMDHNENDIIWVREEDLVKLQSIIDTVKSKIIVCKNLSELNCPHDKTLILVNNPQLFFLRLIKNIYEQKIEGKISTTAKVSTGAKIGRNVFIGDNCIIGNCIIGDNSVIKANTIIHDNVECGSNVLISEFCNIGGQGFGHIQNENNNLENMLHIGKVIIEDDVEIFPYTNVDLATLSETRICKGSKIDHYCHIGHNSYVGQNVIITAQVVLAGGAKILNNAILGLNTKVKAGCMVGENSFTGMGSVVVCNIPSNEVWAGIPAKFLKKR